MTKMVFVKGLLLVLSLTLTGCATIPSEAPELTVELGKRISAIESANITLLHHYFDHFLEKDRVPVFAEEVFSNSRMANEKRPELVKPLDELERNNKINNIVSNAQKFA